MSEEYEIAVHLRDTVTGYARGGLMLTTYHQAAYRQALQAALRPGCRWLDLGAGSRVHGDWTYRGPTLQPTVACDPGRAGLRRNPAPGVVALGPLPFRVGSFDLVTANMVLEHLTDPAAFFTEVSRVLAPGGAFLAVTPHRWHPVVLALSLVPRSVRSLLGRLEGRAAADVFPTYYRANDLDTLHSLAFLAGLVPRFRAFRSTPCGGVIERTALTAALVGPPSNLLVHLTRPVGFRAYGPCAAGLPSNP